MEPSGAFLVKLDEAVGRGDSFVMPSRVSKPPSWSIVVAGAGIPGLALALAVKASLGPAVDVLVCDPGLDRDRADERAFAVSAGVARMLRRLGIWPALAAQAAPIHDMVITDSRLGDPVRPIFLTFAGEAAAGEPYATMVSASALADALRRAAERAGVALRADGVRAEPASSRSIALTFSSGETGAAALLVASDGSRSRLREAAGIGWIGWRYPQSAIVATIGHERDHGGRAVEHFLPAGPFAILPLAPGQDGGHRSSIVWTEETGSVEDLLASTPEVAAAAIARRFGPLLGPIALLSRLHAHPLAFGLARRFGVERMALLGDAAHEIHPLAGQGLNLGLADAASLAEEIVDAVRLGLDPGGFGVIAAYERARRPEAVAMALATDGLNRLFSNDRLPVRLARDFGLGVVDRLPGLKQAFIGRAAGIGAGGSRLLRGEAL